LDGLALDVVDVDAVVGEGRDDRGWELLNGVGGVDCGHVFLVVLFALVYVDGDINCLFLFLLILSDLGVVAVGFVVASPFFSCEFELFDYFAQFAHLPQFEVTAFVPVCGCHELEEL
jgi:hypothetical protein